MIRNLKLSLLYSNHVSFNFYLSDYQIQLNYDYSVLEILRQPNLRGVMSSEFLDTKFCSNGVILIT